MTGPAIEINGLSRQFGPVRALDHIDMGVAPGERVALLGHNGAGKTTLIKAVLGLLAPTSGRICVLGGKPGSRQVRRHCAFLPENLAFHKSLTGAEQLALFCRLKGADPSSAPALLERTGLLAAKDRRIATYSKGMRQRLGLCQLLIGTPRVVILDEPTSGLDPVSRHSFYEIVSELAEAGAAILLSSHVLTELEARTDRIVILNQGSVAAEGRLSRLRADAGLPIRVQVEAKPGQAETLAARLGGRRMNGCAIELHFPPGEKVDRLAAITELAGAIADIEMIPPSLEDLYRHYSGPGQGKETGS